MKTFRSVPIVVTMLALLFALSALTAFAQGAPNTSPPAAAFIDGQVHPIEANGSLWYRFDYAGDRSDITITLLNGTNSGLAFNVFTPNQIADWWNETPIGRGTPQAINCDTGIPETKGACQANDLTWMGNFNAPGTYYVQLMNNTGSALNAQLLIRGSGVTLSSLPTPTTPSSIGGAAVPPPAPTTTTGTTTTGPITNMDPGHALAVNANTFTIPANGSLWYRFTYAGDRSQILITLPNGNLNGVRFNVFTPNQIADWWNETPIGRGTPQAINCDTGIPETKGACQANDLTWSGNFNAAGIYYVQVVNMNSTPASALLRASGSGISTSQ